MARVASGVIRAKGDALAERIASIASELEELVEQHQPYGVAVEAVFHAKNSQSALKLGHARGAVFAVLARKHLLPSEYAPTQVKQNVTGRGRADKEQVRAMVQLLLGCDRPFVFDESDALAVAICHARMCSTPTSRFLLAHLQG